MNKIDNINDLDGFGYTYLHRAILIPSKELVELIITKDYKLI